MHCLLFNFNKKLADNARALGCYRIAHFLREHSWDVEVIDYAAYWNLEQLKTLAKSRITKNTQWIGTSHLFSVWGDTMEEFCLWIKTTYPWIKIISGSAANPAFQSKAIDYYVQGYGEYAILELLKYLFSNGTRPTFNLLTDGGKKIIPAISAYPAYPMSSLMVKYQDRDFILPGEWLGVEFSRGCKFSCAHCNFPVIGVKGDYSRDASDFREQIMDAYDRWGVEGYYMADETFNDRTEKITKFADVVETLPFEPWFTGYMRADLLVSRPRDREELARMGVRGHFYGIESFNNTATRAVGKGMTPERLKQGILEVKDYFKRTGNGLYRADMSFIIGLPGESLSELEKNTEWLEQNWSDESVTFHVLILFKNSIDKTSQLSQEYLKHGYKEMSKEDIDREESRGRLPLIKAEKLSMDRYRERFIFWENPLMTIFDATQMEEKLFKQWHGFDNPIGSRKIDVFRLSSTLLHEFNIQERCEMTNYKLNQFRDKKQKEIVKNYIEKKLSL